MRISRLRSGRRWCEAGMPKCQVILAQTLSAPSPKGSPLRQEWICVEASLPLGRLDVFSELCWELDSVGVEEIPEEDHTRFRAFFDSTQSIQSIENSFNALARDHSIAEFRVTRLRVDPDRWVREYRKQFGGFPVGPTFYIHPPWEGPSKLHPLNLRIKPGRAFGTGTHESTQLCLCALAPLIPGPTNLLDVGTGSGILAIAARKLSAKLEIVAMDSDPEATLGGEAKLLQQPNREHLVLHRGPNNPERILRSCRGQSDSGYLPSDSCGFGPGDRTHPDRVGIHRRSGSAGFGSICDVFGEVLVAERMVLPSAWWLSV